MRKIFILYYILISYSCFSQQSGSITVEWLAQKKISSETNKFNVPLFSLQNLHFDDINKALHYNYKFKTSLQAEESSIKANNISYESIAEKELGDLDVKRIPSSINLTLENGKARDENYILLSFSPIIKTSEGYKKVKSFHYTYINKQTSSTQRSAQNFNVISNSVLATGEWRKFYVEKSGIYKVTKSFLQQLGLNTNGDPRNIKIYGNGGRMIPLTNNEDYPSDLTENAIQFIGEEDGVFNNDDYILFYAEGVDNWNNDSNTNLNIFSDRSYYYVTNQGGEGKRIQTLPSPTGTSTLITSFDDTQFYEKDLVNIGRLGRKWFGEQFNINNTQRFEFNFPNTVPGSSITLSLNAAGVSANPTNMTIKANGQILGTMSFPSIGTDGPLFIDSFLNTSFPSIENVVIEMTFNNNGVPSSNAYLNYINLSAKRNLQSIGKQFRFQYNLASSMMGIGEFKFLSANNIAQVWDITDIYNAGKVENNDAAGFSFKATLGEVRKYIAVDPTDYYIPSRDSQSLVINQNLKGTIFNNAQGQFQDIDYVIVTPTYLKSEADRLANFHRTYSNLNVKVVNLESIYPEFSSGKQDIGAIRNFIKYIYFNASSPEKRIKYLNLFGDASYDYKNRIPNNTNIVPVFHSTDSNSLFSSTMTDDFYGMMDPNEGKMNSGAHSLDIAVGRMIVSTIQEAQEMVTKVIDYHDIQSYGRWRNNFSLISDDVDDSWEVTIEQGIDALGDLISSEKPYVNVFKYHADSYLQETSAGGNRYPKLREDIVSAFEQGSLVFNYFGHGGEDGLAQERIFEKTDAQNLNNRYKYPLFVTVTCEFSRFDNPFRKTAGEFTYWNPKGGAISLITTTRQIGVGTGQAINVHLASNLYGFDSDEEISIAEALRRSKNSFNSSVLMVFYIGDPALKLAIPKPKVVLTKVNNIPTDQSSFVFNALSTVTLTGEVRDPSGSTVLSNYNGDLAVQIFDKDLNRNTLGNDGQTNASGLIIMNFNELGETIFRGNAKITNGIFEFSFVVPRDIRIPIGNGRISFYAKSTAPILRDQTGHDSSIQVGGINENAPEDNIGPTVKLYMNDQTFISGGITNASPIFLAYLEDENGINTASGIGHDIVAILDGDENNPYLLNDFYETELDNYKKGIVRFPFRNLAPGLHTITFRAWDVYNNPITAEIQFIVMGDETVTLTNVLNYPNPFVNHTQFWFTHNRPFEPLDVQVQILTVTGKIVKTINQSVTTEGFLSREITWDGRDDFGDKIGKGVYIYKLTVKSTLTNKKSEKYEKLVIL
jgi:hypothetical protein